MKIWIDLANSPQVPFFLPIIAELKRRNNDVRVTTRAFAQTTELADQLGLEHVSIGEHGGKKLSKIGFRIVRRAYRLVRYARTQRFDLAVSHNSYAQALAAFALRIPFVTLMDYEHQPANHLSFRLATKVIVPECFPKSALRKYGAALTKVGYYNGLKEQVYLSDFVPQPGFLSSLGMPTNCTLAVMRPPGSWGLYHHFENPLFDQAFDYVVAKPNIYVVFLPRVKSQADVIRARGYENVWVPDTALDGPNLLYWAGLVISGGGTMNREAAVLGVPTYSLFKGELAAVDRYLIQLGRLQHIANEAELQRISEEHPRLAPLTGSQSVDDIVDAILMKKI